MQFAAPTNVRGGCQGFYLPGGHVGVRGVKIHRTDKMRRGPFDEGAFVGGDRRGRRIVNMLEDRVKDRPCEPGEVGHELAELAIEIAKKEQSSFAQDREARV